MDGKRVDTGRQFTGEDLIDHTMALKPALPFEGLRHNIHPEMRLPARSVPTVALMLMRLSTTRMLSGVKASVNFRVMMSWTGMMAAGP